MFKNEDVYADLFGLLKFGFTYTKEEIYKNAKGIMVIQHGFWEYERFNICYLHDMLAQALEVMYRGYIPHIERPNEKDEWCLWKDLLYQPFYEFDLSLFEDRIFYSDKRFETKWNAMYPSVFSDWDKVLSYRLYRDFVVIKDKELKYITDEWTNLIMGKRVLGVLARGTDIAAKKPAEHPVQPSIEQLIKDAKTSMEMLNCQYIYLATEERRIAEQFEEAFPGKIITNKRHYLDDAFYERLKQDKDVVISYAYDKVDTSFYQLGLEYLSSIVLLSMCNGLLAGNCGGTAAALYFNGGRYEGLHIYDLGMYQ